MIANPDEGLQLIARQPDGTPLGFATIYWTWQTLYAARVGRAQRPVRDGGVPGDRHRTRADRSAVSRLCHDRGAEKLVWETAPDNATAQRLYDGIGAEKSTWFTYELDA